jgi:hypothetical protein
VIADLYVGDHEGGPLFMEIKSPMPNLDVCAESKKKVLLFEPIKRGKVARATSHSPTIHMASARNMSGLSPKHHGHGARSLDGS